jgi:hypothetical protein
LTADAGIGIHGTVTTSPEIALAFSELLFEELKVALFDPGPVRLRMKEIEDHARGFPESLFTKGCVLPIVDRVATSFLSKEMGLTGEQIHAALRCEGFSTLGKIYRPGPEQSGFSSYPWGTNYQRVSKAGVAYPPEHRGYQPCPDFGIVHEGFRMLGEVKFSKAATKLEGLLKSVRNDLLFYMGLPVEPEKGWHYDFGFGIAYTGGGTGAGRAELIKDHWDSHRFVIAVFMA